MKTEIHIYGREILTGRQTDRQTDAGTVAEKSHKAERANWKWCGL